MRAIGCALLALFIASSSLAQVKKRKAPTPEPEQISLATKWDKEPDTIFGIKLGAAIPAGSLQECIPATRENGYTHPKELCIESALGPYAGKSATLYAIPLGQVTSIASVNFEDALVSSIHINFHHDSHERMREILIERYGPPTNIQVSTAKTLVGATFQSETLSWVGENNTVRLFERWDVADKSLAVFSNNRLSEKIKSRLLNSIKDSAAKL